MVEPARRYSNSGDLRAAGLYHSKNCSIKQKSPGRCRGSRLFHIHAGRSDGAVALVEILAGAGLVGVVAVDGHVAAVHASAFTYLEEIKPLTMRPLMTVAASHHPSLAGSARILSPFLTIPMALWLFPGPSRK